MDGLGYGYFVFNTDGNIMSTETACPNNEVVEKFIAGQPKTVQYNRRLPIVIYVPDDYDVQFKIFKTEGDIYQTSENKHK